MQGLSPELRDAGRSAREPGQGWAIPKPPEQRVRRGRPGRGGSGLGCGHLPPPPARCGSGPDLAPQPAVLAAGRRPPSTSLPGRRPWGERWAPGCCRWGKRGREGIGWEGGTVRRPEPSAQSGGASRSLQQRRPSQTPRSRRGQPSPEAPRAPETARPQHADRRDAPGSCATTHQSQCVLTLALPRLDPKKEGSN